MQRLAFLSSIVLVLATASAVWATETTGQDATTVEIRKITASLEADFDRGDAKAMAAAWTADGSFIGPRGERIVGREQIEAALQHFLAGHRDCKLRLIVLAHRVLSDSVVQVDLVTEITPRPEGLEGEPQSTMLLVKRDGRWLIDSLRETLVTSDSHYSRLKALEWMVGDWADETARSSGVSVRSACDWTANRNFLIRKYTVEGKKGVILSGTEVIGWDPRDHRIRSWMFDSDGGFGESVWTHDGDHWAVKHTGVMADGGNVAVTHIVKRVDADTVSLQSKDRTVNGEKQPDVAEVTIKRRPAQDGANKAAEPEKPPQRVLP